MMSNHQHSQEQPLVPERPKRGTFEEFECQMRLFQNIQIEAHSKEVLWKNVDLYEKILINYAILYRKAFCPQVITSAVTELMVKMIRELHE